MCGQIISRDNMNGFKYLFKSQCSIIGMVHLDALPGTPLYKGSIKNIINKACEDADIYLQNKVDGILIENMFDVPYVQHKHITPEILAVMSRIGTEIRKIVPNTVPCGVQVLAGCNKSAIAIAQACELQFIRAEGFVFSHIADEGFTNADAGILLRYRKQIEAENVLVFCDIKKKHSSHAITSDVSLEETAKAAEFFLADALIITGTSTGCATDVQELSRIKTSTKLPVIVGSGVTRENLQNYKDADALIVGSHFKSSGLWQGELSSQRVSEFMDRVYKLRNK